MKMMKLWIGNLDPKTTDDEIREFVTKYTKLECATLTRVPGDGSRPGVMLDIPSATIEEIYAAQLRLDGMHWKARKLVVTVL
jgi:RNA recognition motif-containing protein